MSTIKMYLPLLFLLFTAFQCEDDDAEYSELESIKLSVSPNDSIVNIGDTIWINGCITSKVLEYATGDSVFADVIPNMFLFFYKMKIAESKDSMNTIMAANDFDFVAEKGDIFKEELLSSKRSYWDKLHRIVIPEISEDSCFLSLKIGLIPKETGVFSLRYKNGFSVDDNHQNLYEQFDNSNEYSFYAQGRMNVCRSKVDYRNYFIKVVDE